MRGARAQASGEVARRSEKAAITPEHQNRARGDRVLTSGLTLVAVRYVTTSDYAEMDRGRRTWDNVFMG
jgi:hypothetical protein